MRWVHESGAFAAQHIKGEERHLEHSSVGSIEGGMIVIGPGCSVASVVYRESLEVAPDSVVRQRRKEM